MFNENNYSQKMNKTFEVFTKELSSLRTGRANANMLDLVKVDVAVNGLVVDSLSSIMHRSDAQRKGRDIARRLREVIPRQMFEIPIQIMLGGKIIARESVKAFRKNVTAKLYGGDVTRKKKLLEKQKAGKKKMKQIGKVALPQEAFLSFLSTDKNK